MSAQSYRLRASTDPAHLVPKHFHSHPLRLCHLSGRRRHRRRLHVTLCARHSTLDHGLRLARARCRQRAARTVDGSGKARAPRPKRIVRVVPDQADIVLTRRQIPPDSEVQPPHPAAATLASVSARSGKQPKHERGGNGRGSDKGGKRNSPKARGGGSSGGSDGKQAAARDAEEEADASARALSESDTDKKLYAGAHAKGWRVVAKDDNGHFHYRFTTHRFTNRTEALLFDRSLEVEQTGGDGDGDGSAATATEPPTEAPAKATPAKLKRPRVQPGSRGVAQPAEESEGGGAKRQRARGGKGGKGGGAGATSRAVRGDASSQVAAEEAEAETAKKGAAAAPVETTDESLVGRRVQVGWLHDGAADDAGEDERTWYEGTIVDASKHGKARGGRVRWTRAGSRPSHAGARVM